MKYAVMNRGHMVLRTDDLDEARAKIRELGEAAYIQYGTRGIEEYQENQEVDNDE